MIVDAIVVMGLRWEEVRLWEVGVVAVRCHFFVSNRICFRICRLNFKVSPDHPMAHLLFVSCVSFVLSRVGLGPFFSLVALPRGAQPSEPKGPSEGRRGVGDDGALRLCSRLRGSRTRPLEPGNRGLNWNAIT